MSNLPNPGKYTSAAAHLPTVERLLANSVPVKSGCREWQLAVNRGGYGVISSQGISMSAHRLSYWVFRGPIEGELVVDHLCHNPRCINPDHFQLLSSVENAQRQASASKTHCVNGHPLSGGNLYLWINPKGRTIRGCRECRRKVIRERDPEIRRRYRARRKARQAALSAE